MERILGLCGDVCGSDFREVPYADDKGVAALSRVYIPVEKKRIKCKGLFENLDLFDRPHHKVKTLSKDCIVAGFLQLSNFPIRTFQGPCPSLTCPIR